MTKVSVLMSVYNGERFLQEAVESILDQTYTDFEFIIVDDGSIDRTWKILSAYSDPRIRLVRNSENIGLSRSLNKGLKLARGEYFTRMDADDISLPERLATQVAFLNKHSEAGLLAGNLEVINEQGEIIGYFKRDCHPDLVKWYELFYNRTVGHSQVMFRASLVRELGEYSETIALAQDYDLWSRIAERAHIVILPQALLQWRKHKSSISSVRLEEQQQSAYRIAYRNLENLIREGWATEEAYLEMIGFWMGRFSMCKNPIRLWHNLVRVQSAFVTQRRIINSEREFCAILHKAEAQQFYNLASYWLGQKRYVRAITSSMLSVISSPSEGFRMLKRKLTRGASEVT